jgi:hypothetical protein
MPTAIQIDEACRQGLFVFVGNRQQVGGAVAEYGRRGDKPGQQAKPGHVWVFMRRKGIWDEVEQAKVIITNESFSKETEMKGKRANDGQHTGPVSKTRSSSKGITLVKSLKKQPKANKGGNLEFEETKNLDTRQTDKDGARLPGTDGRIPEIEDAQDLVERVSGRASKAIAKAHKDLDEAKKNLVVVMHAHGFDADKKPVYSRPPWGNVVLQKKGEIKEEAKFTAGTAKAKKKKDETEKHYNRKLKNELRGTFIRDVTMKNEAESHSNKNSHQYEIGEITHVPDCSGKITN